MSYTGGWKHWNIGDTLLSADVNNYFMSQAIPRFASTSARDAALTGADAPATGQLCYVTGSGLMMYTGSSWGLWQGASYTDVKTITSAAASITWTAIPRTLRKLRLYLNLKADNTNVVYQNLNLRFAGDSGTNYQYAYQYSNYNVNATPIATTGNTAFIACGYCPSNNASVPAYVYGSTTIDVLGWDLPNSRAQGVTCNFQGGFAQNSGTITVQGTGAYLGTGTLNQITILPASGNFMAGSTAILEGTY